MHVIVDGLDIAYERAGKGPAVLMVHGWGSNLKTFDDLAKQLSKKRDVIRVDLPGFGGSQAPKAAWTLDDYATFLDAFLAKLNVERLHGLIGHSLGGRIAIRAQATGHVVSDKLVLLAAHGIANPQSPRLVFYRTIAKVGNVVMKVFPSSTRERFKARLYDRAGSTDYLHVTPAMKETFKNIISQDLRQDAEHVETQTLLIYGADDTTTPASYGRVFADKMPNAELKVIDAAGHYVHTDAPELVAGYIGEFL